MKSYYSPNDNTLKKINKVIDIINTDLSKNVIDCSFELDELVIKVSKENLLIVLNFLKDHDNCLFRQLIDITAVDYLSKKKRFEVVYNLLSLTNNIRIRIKVDIDENDVLPSIFLLYSNADWLEREVFDMFGIYFSNHPDLRRILTDFGFEGYPLRKDFPLSGFTEVYFDEEAKTIKYKPLELEEEYRDFKSFNQWLDLKKTYNKE